MSSLDDRRQRILSRAPGDPEVWRSFKQNTLFWARWWLEDGGELPEICHFMIRERLEPWIAAVEAGGKDLRKELLAVVPAIAPRLPLPARTWIMPTKTYATDGERDLLPEAPVRNLDDTEGIEPQGGLLTALQTGSAQVSMASRGSPRPHRQSYRGNGVCTQCGTEFEQPRGPRSSFCAACRIVARRETAKLHIRLIRGGRAAVVT